jgi:hypothetical protein
VRSYIQEYGTAVVERLASDALKSRDQMDRIAALGGTVGVGLETSYVAGLHGGGGADFCDDTSTTWKHAYRYAVEHMGGRGLAVGSDANGLPGIARPRFGTNACLGATGDSYRAPLMKQMAAAQRNGVRYDGRPMTMDVTDAGKGRFDWDSMGQKFAYTEEEREVWEGLGAAESADAYSDPAEAIAYLSHYDQRAFLRNLALAERVRRYAIGFWARKHEQPPSVLETCHAYCSGQACEDSCLGPDLLERIAYEAYVPDSGPVVSEFAFVADVVRSWRKMWGDNEPLHKYIAEGTDDSGRRVRRDFDVNLEGVAHYGLLPDFMQDVRNVGVTSRELMPLFAGAEDYIEMWRKAEERAADLRRKP